MMLILRWAWVGVLTAMVAGAAHAAPYRVDPARSELVLQVFKDGALARLAHDHVVQATEFSGTIEYDPGAVAQASVMVEAKAASLKVDEPALRHKYKLQSEIAESDRKTIRGNMVGDEQLNVAKFPTLSFKSKKVTAQDSGVLVTGDLTIHGVTKEVSLPATVTLTGQELRAKGSLKFNTSTFKISPYSTMFGAIKNKDEVILNLDLVAVSDTPPAAAPATPSSTAAPPAAAPAK